MSAAARLSRGLTLLSSQFMPLAASETPLGMSGGRLFRLSLFQVSVGMTIALVIGTLNRVMIVELGVSARLVAIMVALPLVFAPARALIGFKSDTHRSLLGWRRVPFLWMGALLQFGGLAIMPFALLLLSGDGGGHAPAWLGPLGAGFAFLLTGAGLHTTQTVGLALATDLAPRESRPRIVTLLCAMLLVGVLVAALLFGLLLARFSETRLIQVIQGAALLSLALNGIALWKQEPRAPSRFAPGVRRPSFRAAWQVIGHEVQARRRLVAVGLGTVAFSLQDVLLEPYGGQVLGLPVGATTALTALLAAGGLVGFAWSGRQLGRGLHRYRLAAVGVLVGLVAFPLVIFAAPTSSRVLFGLGTFCIGCGAAVFAVGTLSGAMDDAGSETTGLSLGTWGAVQAFAAGSAIAIGGVMRDAVSNLAAQGALGAGLQDKATGYDAVYLAEIVLLLATLVTLGPLASYRRAHHRHARPPGAPHLPGAFGASQ